MRTVIFARCHGAIRCFVVKVAGMAHAIQYVESFIEKEYGPDATIISAHTIAYGPEFI
jgi:hypothetical protein